MTRLLEDRRAELVSKGKRGAREKGDGKTRYEKRLKSRFANSTRSYNKINMNELFRNNILTVGIEVKGETGDYIVTIKFGGFLDLLRKRIEAQDGVLDLRAIIRALIDAFNTDNVYIHCSCPDWKYRMNYWATITDINSGEAELRPSDITNPNNNLGPGCKHVMLVLANTGWLIKVASVINNYVRYFEQHRQKEYADIIYPAIYGTEYEEPVQLSIDDIDELESGEDTLDKTNEFGRTRTQFKTGNTQGIRFAPKSANVDQINIEDEIKE